MSPQRRAALVSVAAAAALVALKLAVGLVTHSLGLISEAVHSGTDLVAALLTFFALGVAGRPPDPSRQYGHGKAEHLSALAESVFLTAASVFIGVRAIERLAGSSQRGHATWYAPAADAPCGRSAVRRRRDRRLAGGRGGAGPRRRRRRRARRRGRAPRQRHRRPRRAARGRRHPRARARRGGRGPWRARGAQHRAR